MSLTVLGEGSIIQLEKLYLLNNYFLYCLLLIQTINTVILSMVPRSNASSATNIAIFFCSSSRDLTSVFVIFSWINETTSWLVITSNKPSVATRTNESKSSSTALMDISTLLETNGLSHRSPIARDNARLPSELTHETGLYLQCASLRRQIRSTYLFDILPCLQ